MTGILADDDAKRQSDQIDILELHTRTLVAVVQQHFDAEFRKPFVNFFSHSLLRFVLDRHRHKVNEERRQGGRPNYAVFIMVLFNDGGQHPRNADAVTAHNNGLRLARNVEKRGAQLLAVFGP
ncbi:hypothetical protein D1872_300220 [compost metagenome]